MLTAHRKFLVLAGVSLLLLAATAAGIGAYAIYDQREEIHALQARLITVGQRSERAAGASRALCSALTRLRKTAKSDLASLARLTKQGCAPILRAPAPR
jgi:uncharacterized protein HemX